MLVPLHQWICDTCGEVIHRPEEGWLEWQWVGGGPDDVGRAAKDFRIVHHAAYSPRRPEGPPGANPMLPGMHCYQHEGALRRADTHLHHVTGEHVQPFLYGLLESGPEFYGTAGANGVVDLQEWLELARRLSTPHYEEARFYLAAAFADGRFEGSGPENVYRPEALRSVIEEYGPEPGGEP